MSFFHLLCNINIQRYFLWLSFLFAFVILETGRCGELIPIQPISTKEFYDLHTKDHIIIFDVRSKEKYQQGHIPNAQWLNIEDITFKQALSTLQKEKIYILYDDPGKRSIFVANYMRNIGFTKIYYAKEGIKGWKLAGYRLRKGD